MPNMIRGLLKLIAILLFFANCMICMLAFPAYLRYSNQHQYQNEVFRVTGASVLGRNGTTPILEGEVRGKKEIFIDPSPPSMPWATYLKLVPVGTQIPVKFNPNITSLVLQYQSLRVIRPDWNFSDDRHLLRFYTAYIAAPTVIVLASLFFTRPRKQKS